jgi:hypothetical protein
MFFFGAPPSPSETQVSKQIVSAVLMTLLQVWSPKRAIYPVNMGDHLQERVQESCHQAEEVGEVL